MLNLGPVSERQLREVGIATPAALRRVGALAAYRRLKHRFPREINLVCLYALEGALRDRHWNRLPADLKQWLEEAAGRVPQETPDGRPRRPSRS